MTIEIKNLKDGCINWAWIILAGITIIIIIGSQAVAIGNRNDTIVSSARHLSNVQEKCDEYKRVVDADDLARKATGVELLKQTKSILFDWCLIEAKVFIPEKEIHEIIDIALQYDRWKLILSIITIESHFDRYASSGKNAGGLMQVMHSVWGEELGIRDARVLYDPEENIKFGNEVLDRYFTDNTINDALFKYVGKDKGRVYEKKVLVKYAELSVYLNERLRKEMDNDRTDAATKAVDIEIN